MKKSPIRTFCREEHLKGRGRIREVFAKGRRYEYRGDRLFVLKNGLPHNRICFTFTSGRKFGSAVARNRAKRLGREAFRLLKERLTGGHDLILLIAPNPCELAVLSVRMEKLQSLFKKAGLLKIDGE